MVSSTLFTTTLLRVRILPLVLKFYPQIVLLLSFNDNDQLCREIISTDRMQYYMTPM